MRIIIGVPVTTTSRTAPQVKPPPTPSQQHVLARRGCARRAPPRRAPAGSTPPTCCRDGRPSPPPSPCGRPSFFAVACDDADVGLVRDQPVDRRTAVMPFAASASCADLVEHLHRELEHRAARPSARTAGRTTSPRRHVARHRSRMSRGCRRHAGASTGCPGVVAGAEHHGAGAVAEQHAGAAVVPVEDARDRPRRRPPARSGTCPRRTNWSAVAQRVDEAAAHRLHVEGRAARRAELRLQHAGRAREDHVRRGGGDDDEVEVAGGDAGRVAARCGAAASARSLVVSSSAAMCRCADAGARADPLVGGVDRRARARGW